MRGIALVSGAMRGAWLGTLLALAASAPLTAMGQDGDARRGRKLATTHCARCHVVGDFNPYGGVGSTPSFQRLVRFPDYLERFQTFFERPPHPPFVRVPDVERRSNLPANATEFEITPDNIDDIIAFVESLKEED